MDQTARRILADFKVHEISESSVYNDQPESIRSHLFHTYGFDVATTEREYLEFIYALVRLEKPRRVLESGTGSGIGTLLIASALKQCERDVVSCVKHHQCPKIEESYSPTVTSVDIRFCRGVELLARQYEVSGGLYLVTKPTMEFLKDNLAIRNQAAKKDWIPFDFAVFDSVQDQKAIEAEYMLAHGLFAHQSLLVFHDTSIFHPLNVKGDYRHILHKLMEQYALERLDFPWSRGLTIMRYLKKLQED